MIPDLFGVWVTGALLGGLLIVAQLLKYLGEPERLRSPSNFLRWLSQVWTVLLFQRVTSANSETSAQIKRIRVGLIALVLWVVVGSLYFRMA